MNKKLELLIKELEEIGKQYGDSLQKSATNKDVERLNNTLKENFKVELSSVYQNILLKINGFDENGVSLYGSETNLIQGYSDRYLDGLMEANEIWHENEDFANYLFYADSDLYLFVQSFKNQLYSCRPKDSFDDIMFETDSENEFFEKIFRLAVDDNFVME